MSVLPLHFAFCVSDLYFSYICVTIKGIIENHKNESVTIHVLSDYLTPKKIKLLEELISSGSHAVLQIHIVDDSKLRGLKDTWSKYTWYRVLLPEVLPDSVHRVLYLDGDTLVVGNVSSLFEMDMTDKAIAGAIDILSFDTNTFDRCMYDYSKKYICAGVMLMNLDYWRKNTLIDKIVKWGRENDERIKFADQDTINNICQDHKIVLPMRFGILGVYFEDEVFYQPPYLEELKECISSPAIIHYAGQNPWKIELANHLYQAEWEKYNDMLRHPTKRIYITKGWNFVKMKLWNMLHPKPIKQRLTKEQVINRIKQHDS